MSTKSLIFPTLIWRKAPIHSYMEPVLNMYQVKVEYSKKGPAVPHPCSAAGAGSRLAPASGPGAAAMAHTLQPDPL